MQKLKISSQRVLVKQGLSDVVHAAFVCFEAKKVLKKVFEKDFIKEIKIVSFKNGYLYIQTPNSAYSQEIKIKEKEIVDLAQERVKEEVRGVRFR